MFQTSMNLLAFSVWARRFAPSLARYVTGYDFLKLGTKTQYYAARYVSVNRVGMMDEAIVRSVFEVDPGLDFLTISMAAKPAHLVDREETCRFTQTGEYLVLGPGDRVDGDTVTMRNGIVHAKTYTMDAIYRYHIARSRLEVRRAKKQLQDDRAWRRRFAGAGLWNLLIDNGYLCVLLPGAWAAKDYFSVQAMIYNDKAQLCKAWAPTANQTKEFEDLAKGLKANLTTLWVYKELQEKMVRISTLGINVHVSNNMVSFDGKGFGLLNEIRAALSKNGPLTEEMAKNLDNFDAIIPLLGYNVAGVVPVHASISDWSPYGLKVRGVDDVMHNLGNGYYYGSSRIAAGFTLAQNAHLQRGAATGETPLCARAAGRVGVCRRGLAG